MEENRQWSGKTAGGNFGQRFLCWILKYIKVRHFYIVLYPIIPFCLLFARKINHAIYRYFHDILGYGCWKAFCANVRNAFLFGRVVIDKFALLAGRADQFEIHIRNIEIFNRLLEQQSGFIMTSAHIGNFEILGHCLKQDRKRIKGIIYGGESAVLQARRSSTFKETNVELIPVTADMSHLFTIKDALDNGEIVTILSDRLFGSPKKKTLDFLGHPADFPISTFRLAVQLDVPVVAVFLIKERSTTYTGQLIPLTIPETAETRTAKAEALLQQYVHAMEQTLRAHPDQWFNYYDFWNLEGADITKN